jgi:hypothetical protein
MIGDYSPLFDLNDVATKVPLNRDPEIVSIYSRGRLLASSADRVLLDEWTAGLMGCTRKQKRFHSNIVNNILPNQASTIPENPRRRLLLISSCPGHFGLDPRG